MPALTPYRLFISHAWDHNEEYYKLVKMMKDYPLFDFHDYSVPEHDPLDSGVDIGKKLIDQMNPSQVVVVLTGMYAAHSDWMDFEINQAVRLKKPIIGVKPWGQERVPKIVQDNAHVIHGWNIAPIVASIRDLA